MARRAWLNSMKIFWSCTPNRSTLVTSGTRSSRSRASWGLCCLLSQKHLQGSLLLRLTGEVTHRLWTDPRSRLRDRRYVRELLDCIEDLLGRVPHGVQLAKGVLQDLYRLRHFRQRSSFRPGRVGGCSDGSTADWR